LVAARVVVLLVAAAVVETWAVIEGIAFFVDRSPTVARRERRTAARQEG
jgi:hypothetical protein